MKRNDDAGFVIKNATSEGECPFASPLCGNGIVEPGEECDGTPYCQPGCFIDIPSCCTAPGECIDAPSFSHIPLIQQYCTFNPHSPQWTNSLAGGACRPDGSCERETIAPLSVCCLRRDGSGCYDATVTDSGGLYGFFSSCVAPEIGDFISGALCSVSGHCVPG